MALDGPSTDRRKVLKLSAAAGVVSATSLLAGCTSSANGEQTSESAVVDDIEDLPEVEMRIAHTSDPDPQNFPEHLSRTFKNYMETRTGGKFTVDISAGGELGTTGDTVEQAMDGTLEGVFSLAEGALAPFYPNINVFSVPYIFPDLELANRVVDKEFGDTINEDFLDQTGLRVISHVDQGGFRSFSANEPIESADDLEGLSIRTQPIASHQEMVRQLGASPESVDWTETYDALDQGVVDGQENPIPAFTLGNFEEVQDYIMLNGPIYTVCFNTVNDDWYQDLDPTYQALVDKAGLWAMNDARAVTRILRERDLRYIQEEHGVEVYDPTEEEINELREMTQEPVEDFIRDEMDNPELVDELYDAIEREQDALPGYGDDVFYP